MADTSSLLSQLDSTASSFKSGVSTQASRVHTALDKIDSTVNNVNKKILSLREMIIEGEEKQLAHENILKIEQQINEQLKSYQVVRRSVIDVVKDMDINLARSSTVSQLSEELWMSSSRYWLSYAFIAISAWVQDNREVCNNAVSEAMRRDPVKTSLFFCLLNWRFRRKAESTEWLKEYFAAVDSAHPPRETSFLLQAYLYGIFGRDAVMDGYVQSTVEGWVAELSADTEISAGLVDGYNKYINTLPSVKTDFSTNVLDAHCANVAEISSALTSAGRYAGALKRIEHLEQVQEVNYADDVKTGVDKLLDDLITNYDEEEIKLRNEQTLYKMIMEHEGNVEAAKREYAAYMEKNKDAPNIGEQMFMWAAYLSEGVDESVQKFAVQKTKGWFEGAVNSYDRDVRAAAPQEFKLTVDLWEGTTDGKDREEVKTDLKNKFMAERNKLVVWTKPNIVLGVLAIAALIIGCVVGIAATFYGYIAGGGLFVVLALIVVLTTVVRIKKFPQRIKRAEDILTVCLDEIDAYRAEFEKMTAVKDELLQKLAYI